VDDCPIPKEPACAVERNGGETWRSQGSLAATKKTAVFYWDREGSWERRDLRNTAGEDWGRVVSRAETDAAGVGEVSLLPMGEERRV